MSIIFFYNTYTEGNGYHLPILCFKASDSHDFWYYQIGEKVRVSFSIDTKKYTVFGRHSDILIASWPQNTRFCRLCWKMPIFKFFPKILEFAILMGYLFNNNENEYYYRQRKVRAKKHQWFRIRSKVWQSTLPPRLLIVFSLKWLQQLFICNNYLHRLPVLQWQ